MKPTKSLDEVCAWTHSQMIGVREDQFESKALNILAAEGFDRSLGADRHECRRLDRAVGSV
jgi:hypothetical protein